MKSVAVFRVGFRDILHGLEFLANGASGLVEVLAFIETFEIERETWYERRRCCGLSLHPRRKKSFDSVN